MAFFSRKRGIFSTFALLNIRISLTGKRKGCCGREDKERLNPLNSV